MSRWRTWSPNSAGSCAKLIRAVALFLILVYRATFRGLLGGVCRFQPTCSHYAEQAFQTHPPLQAFWLSLKRLLKCHPLGPFGFDPVPSAERKTS